MDPIELPSTSTKPTDNGRTTGQKTTDNGRTPGRETTESGASGASGASGNSDIAKRTGGGNRDIVYY